MITDLAGHHSPPPLYLITNLHFLCREGGQCGSGYRIGSLRLDGNLYVGCLWGGLYYIKKWYQLVGIMLVVVQVWFVAVVVYVKKKKGGFYSSVSS